MKRTKQIVSTSIASLLACGLATGCGAVDSAASADTAALEPVNAPGRGTASAMAKYAPHQVSLDLGGGALVTFLEEPDGEIGIIERTASGRQPVVVPLVEQQQLTALEAFRALATKGLQEPAWLLTARQPTRAQRADSPLLAQGVLPLQGTVAVNTFAGCTQAEWSTKYAVMTASYEARASQFDTSSGDLYLERYIVGAFAKRRLDACNGGYPDFVVNLDYRVSGGGWTNLTWERVNRGQELSYISTGLTDRRIRISAPAAPDPYVYGLGGAWSSVPPLGSITR
jgi:hypothetical protein